MRTHPIRLDSLDTELDINLDTTLTSPRHLDTMALCPPGGGSVCVSTQLRGQPEGTAVLKYMFQRGGARWGRLLRSFSATATALVLHTPRAFSWSVVIWLAPLVPASLVGQASRPRPSRSFLYLYSLLTVRDLRRWMEGGRWSLVRPTDRGFCPPDEVFMVVTRRFLTCQIWDGCQTGSLT